MASSHTADVIVIGLGAMGSAIAYRLAERGVAVIGLDRFSPPHDRGSSHGETRVTRLAIGEGPEYVPLARRSHELWRQIERDAGVDLLHEIGCLVLGGADAAFLAQTRASARQYEIPHENLSAGAVARRFPMFALDAATEAYFEPGAGYLRPEAAVRAQLGLAVRAGAELSFGERVESWAATASGVAVETGSGSYQARELILCAGPWISQLFPEGRGLFAVYRQVLYWFPIRSGYEALREMPVFVWIFDNEKQEFVHGVGFYGFPAIDGPAGGVKLASETYASTADPDDPQPPPREAEIAEFHQRYIAPRLPSVGSGALRMASCLYTSTRDSRFVIDRHPAHDNVLIVSPCSGHGFKHSAAIGEAVAQRVVEGRSEIDLEPFRLARRASDQPDAG